MAGAESRGGTWRGLRDRVDTARDKRDTRDTRDTLDTRGTDVSIFF